MGHGARHLNWRDVASLLAPDGQGVSSSSSSSSSIKRGGTVPKSNLYRRHSPRNPLRLRVLDTIFLAGSKSSGNIRQKGCNNPYSRQSSQKQSHGQVPAIDKWIYTSKKGEVVIRRDDREQAESSSSSSSSVASSSLWNHVCDRFGRIALSDPANASGPRIVAVGRGDSSGSLLVSASGSHDDTSSTPTNGNFETRFHLTAEQLKRDGIASSALSKCQAGAIQCYVRPRGGRDRIYRAIVASGNKSTTGSTKPSLGSTSAHSNSRGTSASIDILLVEDGSMDVGTSCASVTPLNDAKDDSASAHGAIKNEIQSMTRDILTYAEGVLGELHGLEKSPGGGVSIPEKSPSVTSAILDFVLDERGQLWLSHVDRMTVVNCTSSFGAGDVDASIVSQEQESSQVTTDGILSHRLANDVSAIPNMVIDDGGDVAGGGGIRAPITTTHDNSRSDWKPLADGVSDDQEEIKEKRREGEEEEKNNALIQGLRDRIQELDDKLAQTEEHLNRSTTSALDGANKVKEVNLKLAQLRKQTSHELQSKEIEYSQAILDLKSQLNASRAEVARLQASAANTASSGINTNSNDASGSLLEKDLLAKIDSLHRELTLAHGSWGQERRALASAHAAAGQEQAARHREELAEQRATISSLEDDLVAQKGILREAEKEKIVFLQKLAAAKHDNEIARNENGNLRDELDLLKQTVATIRLNHGAGEKLHGTGNISNDNGTSFASSSNDNDARISTLNNKVAYLKAQLQNEFTVKDEYLSTIKSLRKEKEDMANSHRAKLEDMESRKEQQLRNIQEQLQAAMERPSDHVERLEDEIKVLQSQMEGLKHDVAIARRSEQDAKSDLLEEQALVEMTKQELETSRNECMAALQEIDTLKDASVDATASDNVLRRLDNERRYLKNQLHLEVATKTELTKKVEDMELRMRMAQDTGRQEARSLALERKKEKQAWSLVESQLRESNRLLDAEVSVQKKEIEELTQAYGKTRDQLRIEQASAEQIRAAGQRMAEELRAAQDELQHFRSAADDAAIRHNATTTAIANSIEKADHVRAQEICKLQEETQRALQSVSDSQRDMMHLRRETQDEKRRLAKNFGAHQMLLLFTQRLRTQARRTLCAWHLFYCIDRSESVALDQISSIALEQSTSIEAKIANVRSERDSFWQEKIQEIQMESALRIKEMEKTNANQERTSSEAHQRLERALQEKELLWENKETEIHATNQANMARLLQEHDRQLENVQRTAQERLDSVVAEKEKTCAETTESRLKECNQQWEVKLLSLRNEMVKEQEEATADADKAHEKELTDQRQLLETKISQVKMEMSSTVDQVVAVEKARAEKEVLKATEERDLQWTERMEDSHRKHNAEMNKLLRKQEDNLANVTAQLEASYQEKESILRARSEQIHVLAIEKMQKEAHEERDEAVTREAELWKDKLEEVEKELERQSQLAYERGQADRDATAKLEMQKGQEELQQALERERRDAEHKFRQELDDKNLEMERSILEIQSRQNDIVAKALESAKKEKEQALSEARDESAAALECEQQRLSALAEQETQRAVAAAEEQHTIALNSLQEKLEASQQLRSTEKIHFTDQLQQVRTLSEQAMERRLAEMEQKEREQLTIEREKAQLDFDRQRSEWIKSHKRELDRVKADLSLQTKEEIKKIQQDAKDAMSASIENVLKMHREHEIELEEEKQAIIDERDSLSEKVVSLTTEVGKQQSLLEQYQHNMENDRKKGTMRLLRLASQSMLERSNHTVAMQRVKNDFDSKLASVDKEATHKIQTLQEKLEKAESSNQAFCAQRKQIYDALVHQNRDTLLRQKAQSREVSAQVEGIGKERQELQEKLSSAVDQQEQTQNKIRCLEKEIHDHSSSSSLQGGRVNIAHARKKRRLDEEYEKLLEVLSSKGEEILVIEGEMKSVLERKEVADERMKSMEKNLVEIVLSTHKTVLSIINNSNVLDGHRQ